MMPFTMLKKTFASVATASSTLFSRIGKLGSVRVADPVKADGVLTTPEPTSVIKTSTTESSFTVQEVTIQPLASDTPSDAQASPLMDYKSSILPSISASFSWSGVLADSIKTATDVDWTVPKLIITSPSTATIEADDAYSSPFYLAPDGQFLTSENLRELAEIDFDDDDSQPPMILASALPLLSFVAIAQENETAAATASIEPERKQKLATIVEADESSDAPESDISSLLASIPSSWSVLLADEAIVFSSPAPELAISSMMSSFTTSFSWSDLCADDEATTPSSSAAVECAVPTITITSPSAASDCNATLVSSSSSFGTNMLAKIQDVVDCGNCSDLADLLASLPIR